MGGWVEHNRQWRMTKQKRNLTQAPHTLVLRLPVMPCIRLERGKFESTNQDSAGGKNSSVLM